MCGDFIDLLKHETHNNTKQFLDIMYSLGLFPLIDKPTRITDSSTTLIDNIFTHELRFNLICGIMFKDIILHIIVIYYSHQAITAKSKKLQTVDKFTYIGSTLSRNVIIDDEADVQHSFLKASYQCIGMRKTQSPKS